MAFSLCANNLHLTVPDIERVYFLNSTNIVYLKKHSMYMWKHNISTCIFTGYGVTHVISCHDSIVIIDRHTFVIVALAHFSLTRINHTCRINQAWAINNTVICLDRTNKLIRLHHHTLETLGIASLLSTLYNQSEFIWYEKNRLRMWNIHTQSHTLDKDVRWHILDYPRPMVMGT